MRTPLIQVSLWLTIFLIADQTILAEPIPVVPSDFGEARQPQIALDAGGNFYVAFGKSNSVYVSISTNGLKSFSAPQKVGELKKLALGMRRGPRIVVSDKTIVVSAISHDEGNLFSWISTDKGMSWSSPQKVNQVPKSAREGLHGMAGNARGEIFAAWLDLRSGKTEMWGASSTNGGKNWGTNLFIYKSPDGHVCECCHPSVAMDDEGKIAVMWRNWLGGSRDMYAATSDDGGKTFRNASKLGTGTWKLNACPMDGGNLILADGKISSVWRRDRKVIFTPDEKTEFILDDGTQPVFAPTKNGFDFVWQKGTTLMWKNSLDAEPKILAKSASFPVIVSRKPGESSVVAWESTSGGGRTIVVQELK